jgi:hypothetical protein
VAPDAVRRAERGLPAGAPLAAAHARDAAGAVARFLAFVRSAEGARVIGASGAVAAP